MGGADAPTDTAEVAEYVWGLVHSPDVKTGGFYAQGKLRAW